MAAWVHLVDPAIARLCRATGRAFDLCQVRINTSWLGNAITSLAVTLNTDQKTAVTLLIRSLSMRRFRQVPDFAIPEMQSIFNGVPMNSSWVRRNRWIEDANYFLFHRDDSGSMFEVAGENFNFARIDGGDALGRFDSMPAENLRYGEALTQAFQLDKERRFKRDARKAEKVALELLRRNLTDEQRMELLTNGYFTVIGSDGGVFRLGVDNSSYSIVEMYGKDRIASWCIVGEPDMVVVPNGGECVISNRVFEQWPAGDVVLARKLLIETDEAKFREIGNRQSERKPTVRKIQDVVALSLLMVEHATDHEWWNAILRSVKVSIPSPELVS